jgi:hypothetical protein
LNTVYDDSQAVLADSPTFSGKKSDIWAMGVTLFVTNFSLGLIPIPHPSSSVRSRNSFVDLTNVSFRWGLFLVAGTPTWPGWVH